eukprot:366575-Chlamydomonas_euryale.AAC.6
MACSWEWRQEGRRSAPRPRLSTPSCGATQTRGCAPRTLSRSFALPASHDGDESAERAGGELAGFDSGPKEKRTDRGGRESALAEAALPSPTLMPPWTAFQVYALENKG